MPGQKWRVLGIPKIVGYRYVNGIKIVAEIYPPEVYTMYRLFTLIFLLFFAFIPNVQAQTGFFQGECENIRFSRDRKMNWGEETFHMDGSLDCAWRTDNAVNAGWDYGFININVSLMDFGTASAAGAEYAERKSSIENTVGTQYGYGVPAVNEEDHYYQKHFYNEEQPSNDKEWWIHSLMTAIHADRYVIWISVEGYITGSLMVFPFPTWPQEILLDTIRYLDVRGGASSSVVVIKVTEDAEIKRDDLPWVDAQIGMRLRGGDEISTGPDSEVYLLFPDESVLVVRELTQIKVGFLLIQRNSFQAQIMLKMGEVAAQVNPNRRIQSDFSVGTPIATAGVRGTTFGVRYDSTTHAGSVYLTEGGVLVEPADIMLDEAVLEPWQAVSFSEAGFDPVSDIVLTGLEVSATNTTVAPGDTLRFSAKGFDAQGNDYTVKAEWTAAGGQIDSTGLFVAGSIDGTYEITGEEPSFGLSDTIEITVAAASGVATETISVPERFVLYENYPDPFNPATQITFTVPYASVVHLTVYDALGREAERLWDGPAAAGLHRVTFEAAGLPSGLYVYRLLTPVGSITRSMVLAK